MRKPVYKYTDEKITKRINYALRIIRDCGHMPDHLREEYEELTNEALRRDVTQHSILEAFDEYGGRR